jgi:tetratricopeptide (TPR) repeat protein
MLACVWSVSFAREPATWTAARTQHFEVYSDAAPETARSLAAALERLHGFIVRQVGLSPVADRVVRVIAFASTEEYARYRTDRAAGAYFVGTGERDYIVMPVSARTELRFAAHEYAHVVMHSGAWTLPCWIAEGVSDVVSTVQFRERESRIGGDLAERSAALKSARWLPLGELFACGAERGSTFYAESWAVADLLMFAPSYSARFPTLLAALASGVDSERALREVYGVTPAAIERDVRARLVRGASSVPLPPVADAAAEVRVTGLTTFAARALLADLHFANGEFAVAESLYGALARERPNDPEIHAAIGTLALRRGDSAGAAAAWRRAIDLGIADSVLCYRYAVLADERGLPARAALERAIALRPDFDDARFKLALIEKNGGHPEAAVAQLRAMRQVAPPRAFAWWSALGDALLSLDRRAEAREAAVQAQRSAGSAEERDHAAQLEWLAMTELAVEIDGGNVRAVRVPAGTARNPFVAPGDRPQRVEGALREVECGEKTIRLVVDTADGALTLDVPDPSRVEIRNAGAAAFEFTCGPQEARQVVVEYAATSRVLRGLEMK